MVAPYRIHIPDERLAVIAGKVTAFDWGQMPDAGGWTAGVGLADLRRLVDYWRTAFDWRAVEARLNQLPHFTTVIDGQTLHFIHVKGDGSKPPLLLLHGWPGSFIEFEALLEPLTADGHDVIVPSLPGYAFSTPITGVLGPRRTAALMHELMARVCGHQRFVVQGGDWGSFIAGWMAYDRPERLLGLHLNMANLAAEGTQASTPEEQAFFKAQALMREEETGYSHLQRTRPQTLGVALADSPVGAAAWILEKCGQWADLPKNAQGDPDLWSRFTEDQLLTNIMLYVASSAMVTATWLYHGRQLEGSGVFPPGTRIMVPMAFAAFPDPVFAPPPRTYVEKAFNVVQWSDMPTGGHFAAWEQPALMLADVRRFIATLTRQVGKAM